jgi:hypothetical protein
MKKSILPLLAFLLSFHAAPAGKFALTIDNIMRGPGLFGWEPEQVRWSGDGQRLYFQWKQASDPLIKDRDTYVVGRDGSGLRKLSDSEAKVAPPASGDTTPDRTRTVYAHDGDIFLYDPLRDRPNNSPRRRTRKRIRILRTTENELLLRAPIIFMQCRWIPERSRK